MSEQERNYACETIRQITQERLEQRRTGLDAELAAIALRQTELERLEQEPPFPLIMMVRASAVRWEDDKYVGGYVTRGSVDLNVKASYFLTAYLGALAKAPDGGERIEISLGSIETQQHIGEYPQGEVREAFDGVKAEADAIAATLSEDIKTNNAYKDIPIKINKYELHDALLRAELLRYCESIDEHFSIEVIPKK